ncbi:MAG: helix-turn-helix domain-containing protein [Candidatus Electrothrix scaldis]|nr:MAG: helix-turn-helix domain-containing protein [Candidatus Electrothrix sp. GW3-3]
MPSSKKIEKQSFNEIERRIKEEFNLSKSSQVIEMIGIPQGTYSTRKNRNNFSEEWAVILHIHYNLQIQWILSGKGKKYVNEENSAVKCDFLEIIDSWISEMKEKEPEREAWFKVEFKKLFPEFKMWLDRKSNADGRNTSISKVA